MTREEAKEMLPIIQAFAEGKEIEFRSKGFDEEWRELKQIPGLSYDSFEYRIKPEPEYRPFKDAEECWQEMQKHQPFGWLMKGGIAIISIGRLSLQRKDWTYGFVSFIDADTDAIANYDFEEMLKNLTFADGAPFGVKERA